MTDPINNMLPTFPDGFFAGGTSNAAPPSDGFQRELERAERPDVAPPREGHERAEPREEDEDESTETPAQESERPQAAAPAQARIEAARFVPEPAAAARLPAGAPAAQPSPSQSAQSQQPVPAEVVIVPADGRPAPAAQNQAQVSEQDARAGQPAQDSAQTRIPVERPQAGSVRPPADPRKAIESAAGSEPAAPRLTHSEQAAPAPNVALAAAPRLRGAAESAKRRAEAGRSEPVAEATDRESPAGTRGETSVTNGTPALRPVARGVRAQDARVRVEQLETASAVRTPPHRSAGAAETATFDAEPLLSSATGRTHAFAPAASSGASVPVPAQQVLAQVKPHLKPGVTDLRIRLNPPDLGSLRLRFLLDGDGLRVTVRASRSEVVAALKNDLNSFTNTLRDAGIDVTSLDIDLEDAPEHGSADELPEQAGLASTPPPPPETAPETSTLPARGAPRPHHGTLDVMA